MTKAGTSKAIVLTILLTVFLIGICSSSFGCWYDPKKLNDTAAMIFNTGHGEIFMQQLAESVNTPPRHSSPPEQPALKTEPAKFKSRRTPTIAPGSCPYLYTWNGTGYILDNDIIPFKYPSLENSDYYRIQQSLKPEDGYYKIRIAEELPETSYLDSVRLITIDHPSAIEVYPDLKGQIFNISNPKPLLSGIDNHGNDCTSRLKGREEDVYTSGTYFEGSQGEYFIADFGDLSGNKIVKLVVTSDGTVDTSLDPGLNPGSGGGGRSIRVDSLITQDGVTNWVTRFVFHPHELWATNVFDITNLLPDTNGHYKLRFYFTNTHKVDFIGIDTTPEVEKEVHELAPAYARAGVDVLSQVGNADGKYLVMNRGDELFLRFPYQPANGRINLKRDFMFISRGYYIPDQK
jgi:hypothetical protein